MKTDIEEHADYVGTIDEIIAACIKDGYRASYCLHLSNIIKQQISEGEPKSRTIFLIKDNESGGFEVKHISILIK